MNSSPSSPTIQKRSSIPPPWNNNLVRSYNQNYAKNNTENSKLIEFPPELSFTNQLILPLLLQHSLFTNV